MVCILALRRTSRSGFGALRRSWIFPIHSSSENSNVSYKFTVCFDITVNIATVNALNNAETLCRMENDKINLLVY